MNPLLYFLTALMSGQFNPDMFWANPMGQGNSNNLNPFGMNFGQQNPMMGGSFFAPQQGGMPQRQQLPQRPQQQQFPQLPFPYGPLTFFSPPNILPFNLMPQPPRSIATGPQLAANQPIFGPVIQTPPYIPEANPPVFEPTLEPGKPRVIRPVRDVPNAVGGGTLGDRFRR